MYKNRVLGKMLIKPVNIDDSGVLKKGGVKRNV